LTTEYILIYLTYYLIQLLNANRVKKGYYIRRLKESLWSTFSVNKIKPYEDNYTKDQIREWKKSDSARQVHKDLYTPSNPDDPSSDTYVALIIRSVFPTEKERTQENAIWTQSVLEAIFDERHISTKIDSDVVETWTENFTDTELVNF
jgi:hypothetical protein